MRRPRGLLESVEEASWETRSGPPCCYVIPDDSPNAFATGRNPQHAAVAATAGIMRVLNEPELEGVIAHELASSTATS